MMCRYIGVIAVLFFVLAADVAAQVERVLPRRGGSSLEGTAFVVGFMANEILEVGEDPRVQIFVSSQFDANVTISSPLSGPATYVVPASTVRVFSINATHVVNASEQVSQKAIFVESDVPIVVYTLNTLALSTDSYTAIPIKHCGTDYYTVNRPTDWYPPGRRSNPLDRVPRVGEFMIMATQDGTDVVVDPRAGTKAGRSAGQQFSVRLNRGDCYLVQARATRHGGDDLTGSVISSNLPVAVLSGHMRSSIPTDSILSKDHLVEQLPPVNKWGRTYATSPFAQIVRPDAFRLVASRRNQLIRLTTRSGTTTLTMPSAGSWRDTVLKEPAYWTSDAPFLLTQFMSSSSLGAYGDPAMVVVPPIEQYVNQTMFQFPVLEETRLDNQQFYYFLNIVAEASALSTLRVNTSLATTIAPSLRTQTIPGTTLHWATVQLRDGAHTMQADSGLFSGVMYGTSIVDSYANMVGVAYDSVRSNDASPPRYLMRVDCGQVNGSVRDTSSRTARLDDVRVITTRTTNYRWSILPSTDDPAVVEIWAEVKDLWRDARIVIHAYDDQGNGREWLYTYDAPSVEVPADVVIDLSGPGLQCTTAVIRNRDTTAVMISRLTLSGDARFSFSGPPVRDTVIAPGDSLVISVCMLRTGDTSQARGTITIEYPCRLKQFFNVRSATGASLGTSPLDFGDVRLGDTACGRLPIINDGPSPVTVTALVIGRLWPQFRVSTSSLGLPRQLRPGDTLWVDVCFVPDSLGTFTRQDTVRSLPDCGLRTSIRGRGVRPEVPSIVVNWGQRRVGRSADSTAVLRNIGTGWTLISGWQAWSDSLVRTSGPPAPVRLIPSDSTLLTLRALPLRRGIQEQIDTVLVDWAPHPSVTIRHIVLGLLPDLRGVDTDFGTVLLGSSKDSLIDHVISGSDAGNAPVAVRSVRVIGPDIDAFDVPVAVTSCTSLAAVDTLRARTTFTPRRIGSHVCTVEVAHDGRAGDADSVTRYVLRGVGLKPVAPALRLELSGAVNAPTCRQYPVTITVKNGGDGPSRVDTVELLHGGQIQNVFAQRPGVEIEPGGEHRWFADVLLTGDSEATITARVVDAAGNALLDSVTPARSMPDIELSMSIEGAPLLVTGDAEVVAVVGLRAPQEVALEPRMSIVVPRSRFVLSSPLALISRTVPAGAPDTALPVRQSDEQITVTLPASSGSWQYRVRLQGLFLWRDPRPFNMSITVDSTECFTGAAASVRDLTVAPCGSAARVVRLGGRPGITTTVLGTPVRDELRLRIESSVQTTAQIRIETLTGQTFTLLEGFSLQKGVQHCNFSCSGWASGIYRVLVQGSFGETDCKVIIVN